MTFLYELSVPLLALLIFALRIVDVSLGTMRTLSVVSGHVRLSVLLGFFEVLVWVTAISQVITRLPDSPFLAVAYAGGFAAGNATGIFLERTLRLGRVVVRIISARAGGAIAQTLRDGGYSITTFEGHGGDGDRLLIYTTCPRRRLEPLLALARAHDPDLFYAVERFSETSDMPLPDATGWRAMFNRK